MEKARQGEHAVIILNYKRPCNIALIVDLCLKSMRRPHVYVIDNAIDCSARAVADRYPGVIYLPQHENGGCGRRYSLSTRLPHRFYLAIDDDVLLQPVQIDALFDRVEAQPGRAHGIWGDGFVFEDGVPAFYGGLTQRDVAVPMLNRVYAYSAAYLAEATALLPRLGLASWDDLRMTDYMLFSLGGPEVPFCHALGGFAECRTANEPGIATWKEADFDQGRTDLLVALLPHIRHERAVLEAMTKTMWRQPRQPISTPAAVAMTRPQL